MKDIQTGVELNDDGRCVLGSTKPRFICEYTMRYRIANAVPGCETVEDLERYLSTNPHPDYRLASCQHMQTGNWHLVWELNDSANRITKISHLYACAKAYIDCNVCDRDTTAEMWAAWQRLEAAQKEAGVEA